MSKEDSEKALLILQKIFISEQGPGSFKSHLQFVSMAQAGSRKLADVKAGTEAKYLSLSCKFSRFHPFVQFLSKYNFAFSGRLLPG